MTFYTRRYLISCRDNNLTKENRGLHMGLLCLSMCGILRTEHKRSHIFLQVHGLGNARDQLSWCQHWIQSPLWFIAKALLV